MSIIQKIYLIINSKLFINAGTYGVFSLLNNAIPFLLLPILTRYLTPDDYGYVSIFNVMYSLFIPIIGCNFAGSYSRAFFLENKFHAPLYFGTVTIATLVIGFLITVVIIFLQFQVGLIFSFPFSMLCFVSLAATAKCINDIILVHWQVRNKPFQYGMFLNLRTIFQAGMSIVLVTIINLSWQGQIFAIVAAPLLFAPIGLAIMIYNSSLVLSFNKDYLKHALFFGVPLVPHALAGILNSSINRIFISKMVGMAETGLFTVGFQIGSVVLLFAAAFNQAYTPWLFSRLNLKSELLNIKIVKITYLYFIIILFCTLIFGFSAPWFLSFFVGKSFQASYVYIIWIALGFAFTGMYYMVVNYIFYAERTHYLAIATVSMSFLNIILNYVLIKINGSIGAAQATTITSFCTFLLVWYLSSKVYKMPWNIFKLFTR